MKNIFKIYWIRQTIYWLSFSLILGSLLYIFADVDAFKITFIIVIPVIPAVYLNFYLFERFFQKGKYFKYALWLAISLGLCTYFAHWAAETFYNTDEENLGAFLDPFLFVLVTMGFKTFKDSIKHKIQIQEARAKQAEAELKISELESKHVRAQLDLLKAQVNPHFLFNTLNNIYSLALDNSENTAKAVMLLSKLMRFQLEQTHKPKVLLKDEIQFIQDYIELEKFRVGNKCDVKFFVDFDSDSYQLPPMLLTPIVENCFKHGIGIKKSNNHIHISILANHKELLLATSNNIPEEKSQYPDDKREKTGLKNIQKRLEISYPDKHSLEISKENSTFSVRLKLSL